MNIWMAFVSIIAIVAIVLVAGGLIALIGHMIIGVFDNEKRPTNKEVIDYSQYKQLENAKNTKTEEYDFEAINQAKLEREQALINKEEESDIFKLIDEEDGDIEEIERRLKHANESKQEVKEEVVEEKKSEVVEPKEEKVEETKTEEKPIVTDVDDDLDLDNMLEEISKDIIEEQKEAQKVEEVPQMSEQLSAYNIDEILARVESETNEESQVEESEVQPVEETNVEELKVEEVQPEDEQPEDENPTDEQPDDEESEGDEPLEIKIEEKEEKDSRLENANQEIEDLKAQLAELNKQLDQARNSKIEVVTINTTEEECVARLEVLEERLKNVKKDYKTNMKEYRPLKKIMNDLEKYQAKLRRKENVVAKKKIALYGVNNYVDLDKEKAEKLAKEIELWEGLRLSVSHCEDVINANKDRYPILERTNKILEDQIASLEADIASTQETLNKIREKAGEGSNQGEDQE